MKELFVSYDIANELQYLGFKEECIASYNLDEILFTDDFKDIAAPLYQQAFKWFRDNHKLIPNVFPISISAGDKIGYRFSWVIQGLINNNDKFDETLLGYLTYEESELECLKELIKIVKK